MSAGQDTEGRYVFLDYLRALAAWLVVWDRTPLSAAILLASGASLAASYLTYLLIETPSQRLARRLSRSRPSAAVAV